MSNSATPEHPRSRDTVWPPASVELALDLAGGDPPAPTRARGVYPGAGSAASLPMTRQVVDLLAREHDAHNDRARSSPLARTQFSPGPPQPETQVHVLDIHEITLIEPPYALPSTPRQQHAGPRHPIHHGRLVARNVVGVVTTGCRIARPHGTEKPVDRSRHQAGNRAVLIPRADMRSVSPTRLAPPWMATAHPPCLASCRAVARSACSVRRKCSR